ncbi:MAG: hypothetical protein ACRDTE_04275 [Pseudonocardiaceae bacterium]
MSAGQARPMILAIGSRDDFLHAYQDVQELLADHDIGAGPDEISGPLEFFDGDGYRLTGTYDRQWQLQDLTRTTESPNRDAVQQRVQNVIDHMRSAIERHPEEAALYGMTVDEVLELFPRLSGPTDLEAAVRAFTGDAAHGHVMVAAGAEPDERPGNRKHNWAHRLGWKHR